MYLSYGIYQAELPKPGYTLSNSLLNDFIESPIDLTQNSRYYSQASSIQEKNKNYYSLDEEIALSQKSLEAMIINSTCKNNKEAMLKTSYLNTIMD